MEPSVALDGARRETLQLSGLWAYGGPARMRYWHSSAFRRGNGRPECPCTWEALADSFPTSSADKHWSHDQTATIWPLAGDQKSLSPLSLLLSASLSLPLSLFLILGACSHNPQLSDESCTPACHI